MIFKSKMLNWELAILVKGGRVTISVSLFARYLNTRVSTIQKWETGAKHPSRTYIALGLLPSDKR